MSGDLEFSPDADEAQIEEAIAFVIKGGIGSRLERRERQMAELASLAEELRDASDTFDKDHNTTATSGEPELASPDPWRWTCCGATSDALDSRGHVCSRPENPPQSGYSESRRLGPKCETCGGTGMVPNPIGLLRNMVPCPDCPEEKS